MPLFGVEQVSEGVQSQGNGLWCERIWRLGRSRSRVRCFRCPRDYFGQSRSKLSDPEPSPKLTTPSCIFCRLCLYGFSKPTHHTPSHLKVTISTQKKAIINRKIPLKPSQTLRFFIQSHHDYPPRAPRLHGLLYCPVRHQIPARRLPQLR